MPSSQPVPAFASSLIVTWGGGGGCLSGFPKPQEPGRRWLSGLLTDSAPPPPSGPRLTLFSQTRLDEESMILC